MDDPPPANARARTAFGRDLVLRIVSAAVLAPVAVGVAYIGGWPFVAFWTIAAIGILWEWHGLIARADHHWVWMAAGCVYAGALLGACVVLRADPQYGFIAIIFLFAIVWATDILAYFVGRLVGGPKLWIRVSPNKTWSGALGGALGAIVAGLGVAQYAQIANLLAVAALALLLSVASQAGDLFESAFKRRFGVKDASRVIPGHGGIMDRLDGFLAAAAVAAMIGLLRCGLDATARGLLVW